jgi:polar amino acid transport system substrate-binding protein
MTRRLSNPLARAARWMPIAALIAIWMLGVSAITAQSPPPFSLVSTAWPPFTNPPGQPRFALDLVEAALQRVGLTSRTAIVSAAQFTPALLQERFDGSGALWKDADRERILLFSEPYLENRLVLIGRHGADVSARTIADLRGKRIAIVDGYSYGPSTELAGPTFVRSSSEEDSVQRLLKGSVDYTLMDELVIDYIVSSYPDESAARLQIGSTPLIVRELYFAIRRSRPDAGSIIARFNAQLRGMIVDGTYHRLLHVDWIRADVNGNGVPVYVPATDHPGPSQPDHAYSLFAPPAAEAPPKDTGFFIGGSLYSDWASVPDAYKVGSSGAPDPRRAAGTIFTIRW